MKLKKISSYRSLLYHLNKGRRVRFTVLPPTSYLEYEKRDSELFIITRSGDIYKSSFKSTKALYNEVGDNKMEAIC